MSALRNACAVLRLFGPDSLTLSVSGVAARLDLPKSTTSRLLAMMAEEGLLEPVPGSRGFRAGPLPVAVAQSFRAGSSLLNEMAAELAALVGAFGHTGFVSVRDGVFVFAVRALPGRNPLRVMRPVGQRLAAHATATGRTLLARLPRREVAALYAGGLPAAPPAAPQDLAVLGERLDRIAKTGLEEALDEANPGVGSIAAAVADPEGRELASFCLSFPLADMTDASRAAMRARLAAVATRLGLRFADPFWCDRAAKDPSSTEIA